VVSLKWFSEGETSNCDEAILRTGFSVRGKGTTSFRDKGGRKRRVERGKSSRKHLQSSKKNGGPLSCVGREAPPQRENLKNKGGD